MRVEQFLMVSVWLYILPQDKVPVLKQPDLLASSME
jgi:hypothetical protein